MLVTASKLVLLVSYSSDCLFGEFIPLTHLASGTLVWTVLAILRPIRISRPVLQTDAPFLQTLIYVFLFWP
jgi:hypothetical protein